MATSVIPMSLASEVNSIKSRANNFLGYNNTLREKNIDDYNDASHIGIYSYNGWSSGADATTGTVPFTSAYGLIFVYDSGFGGIIQTAFNTNTGIIYRRTYSNGAWNAWTASS